MSFGESNDRNNRWDIYYFLILIVILIPVWAPRCVPDPKEVCRIMCERDQQRDYLDYSASGFMTECICGSKIKRTPIFLMP
jgi:hypothetical protein